MQVHRKLNPNSTLLGRVADSSNTALRSGMTSGNNTQVLHTLSFLHDAGLLFVGEKAQATAELLLAARTGGNALVAAQSYQVLLAMVEAESLPAPFVPKLLDQLFASRPLASAASNADTSWPLLVAQ
jgi:hypothetical protein